MIDRKIGKIKLRRGLEAERLVTTFDEGELVYIIDKKRIYVGDGRTVGGNPASNRNYIVNGAGIPASAIPGDLLYRSDTNVTYIISTESNNITLKLIEIFNSANYSALQTKIDDLYTKLDVLQTTVG